MKLPKFIEKLTCAYAILTISCFSTYASTPQQQAEERIKKLESLVAKAKESGIEVSREECALWMAEEFLMYAAWDEKNVDQNEYQYTTWPPYAEDARRLAEELPDFERTEVVAMLDTAIEELSGVMSGKYTRRDAPQINRADIKPEGSDFYSNGRPVFTNDYFTKPSHQQNEYLGMVQGLSLTLGAINEDGSLSQMGRERLVNDDRSYSGYVLLWHGTAPSWIQEREPDVAVGKRLFTHYDIDNPLIREAWDLTFKATAPLIKKTTWCRHGLHTLK